MFTKLGNSLYNKPYSIQEIRDNYGQELADKLLADPVHRYRAETGIELLHKEPTTQEAVRILNNWRNMSKAKQLLSDKKSVELFGKGKLEHFKELYPEYI